MDSGTVKFFITPVYPYGNDHYYHEIIGLAEGFEELGFKVIGNCDYWFIPEEQRFLISESFDEDFDMAIYDHRYVRSFDHLLFRRGFPNFDKTKKHILIDRLEDWLEPKWAKNKNYKVFDAIFSCNLISGYKIPKNVYPWAMGLTHRMIKTIDLYRSEIKNHVIGFNSRVDHEVRKIAFSKLIGLNLKYPLEVLTTGSLSQERILGSEIDNYYFKSTTRRHNPKYYTLLNETLLFSSIGGYIHLRPTDYYPFSFLDKVLKIPYKFGSLLKINPHKTHFIFQWDSFRLWECFYAETCPLNFDFDSWGFILPEMPQAGKHYLSIKAFDFNKFETVLNAMDLDEIREIGKTGKEWVLKYYSPKAQANRLINSIDQLK